MASYSEAFAALNAAHRAANKKMVETTGLESSRWQQVAADILAEMSALTLKDLAGSADAYAAQTKAVGAAKKQLETFAKALDDAAKLAALLAKLLSLFGTG